MVDNETQEVFDSHARSQDTENVDEPTALLQETWQLWLGLDFEIKILAMLLVWLTVSLLLIRIAWHFYGRQLSDILVKGMRPVLSCFLVKLILVIVIIGPTLTAFTSYNV